MRELTEKSLVEIARHYYPAGFPITTDDYSQDLHPYQRTPEYAHWRAAWERAMAWPEWSFLLEEIRASFRPVGECTQPWVAACRRCCIYVEQPLPDGTRIVTRVAAAASILAPLYVTYCTTVTITPHHKHAPRFSFVPIDEIQGYATQLAALVERVLGYQAFPLQLASVQVPDLRVAHLFGKDATLLDALFDSDLANLP
jgi:hypothetical protein